MTVNGSVTTVPLTVSVFNQTIPAYGSPEAAIQGTDIRTDFRVSRKADMGWMKFARYARLGLENRVSLWFDGSFGTTDAEWATVAPLLQGTDPAIRLPGSRLTSVSFVKGTVAGDIASMHSRLQSIGQTDKAYFWCDEVLPATCRPMRPTRGSPGPGCRWWPFPGSTRMATTRSPTRTAPPGISQTSAVSRRWSRSRRTSRRTPTSRG